MSGLIDLAKIVLVLDQRQIKVGANYLIDRTKSATISQCGNRSDVCHAIEPVRSIDFVVGGHRNWGAERVDVSW